MSWLSFGYEYVWAIASWWLAIVLAGLGLNEVAQKFWGDLWARHSLLALVHRHRGKVALVVLVLAQASAYKEIKDKYDAAQAPAQTTLRYSLGGSTDVFQFTVVPFDRWVPIKEFRDVTLEWSRDREATVEGRMSFSALGPGEARCRLRLINVADGDTLAASDWIARPKLEPLQERADVRVPLAVPRGTGAMVYRLEITSDRPNGDCVASGDMVFAHVR